jgi:hypothetical protein
MPVKDWNSGINSRLVSICKTDEKMEIDDKRDLRGALG